MFSFTTDGDVSRDTTCSMGDNLPPSNMLLEKYGPGSRCLTHGRQWTVDGQIVPVYGGGCYQVSVGEGRGGGGGGGALPYSLSSIMLQWKWNSVQWTLDYPDLDPQYYRIQN